MSDFEFYSRQSGNLKFKRPSRLLLEYNCRTLRIRSWNTVGSGGPWCVGYQHGQVNINETNIFGHIELKFVCEIFLRQIQCYSHTFLISYVIAIQVQSICHS